MEEGVELGEGLAALGPQGVRRIQNPRNPLLLVEGREGNLEAGYILRVEVYPLDKMANAEPSVWGVNPMVLPKRESTVSVLQRTISHSPVANEPATS